MMASATWADPVFKQTIIYVSILMLILGGVFFPFRHKLPIGKATWASWVSWAFALPVLFTLLALEGSWPLAGFIGLSIMGLREFFKITGIYHAIRFTWASYLAVIGSGLAIHYQQHQIYMLIPMLLMFALMIVPILINDYKQMLKMISLCLIGFMLIGWSFLHLGWLVKWEFGHRHLLYIILLTEFCDSMNLAFSKLIGKTTWFSNIAPRRTVEGFALSFSITMIFAFGLRHLLPETTEVYWISAGITASLVGGMGDIVLSGIRRDIQVKDRNAFIIGRSGVLDRLDRLIFVAPLYYYTLKTLQLYSI